MQDNNRNDSKNWLCILNNYLDDIAKEDENENSYNNITENKESMFDAEIQSLEVSKESKLNRKHDYAIAKINN